MAPLLKWRPEYSVHQAELDRHHIRLFEIFNTVYENVMKSYEVDMDSVLPIIDELYQFTSYHFSVEERHMMKLGARGLDSHIAKHREFTQTIETLKANYHGNNLEVSQELIILLGHWLLSHVLTEDMKYAVQFADPTT